jgi:hypothetical protein
MIKLEDLIETKIFNNLFSMDQVDENEIKNFLKNPTTVFLNRFYLYFILILNLFNLSKVSKYFRESNFNTDNSWIEYKILNFHDENSQIFNKISLRVLFLFF